MAAERTPATAQAALRPEERARELDADRYPATHADISRLLDFAERLLERCDQHEASAGFWTALAGVSSLALLTAWGAAAWMWSQAMREPALAVAALGALGYLVALQSFLQFRRMRRRRLRDERALHRIVSLIREAAPVVSRAERWSVLAAREVDLRLSRFDIGPGPESGS